jgi:hypothetical protein
MRDPRDRAGLAPADARFLKVIEEHDWIVTTVAPRVNEEGNSFAYSTGMYYRYRHPEILIFGLSCDTMHSVVNEIGGQVRLGKTFRADVSYPDIFQERLCQFRTVEKVHYREHLGWSTWFYEGQDYPTLQCFWPDNAGHFPWENGCATGVAACQPELFRPPYGHA